MPEAIIGKVTALDPGTRTLRVSAAVTAASGEERTEDIEVPFSGDTAFKSKRKRTWGSKPERVKPGMDVIVQREGPGAPAGEVWHTPVIGPISIGPMELTAQECEDLGGTLSTSSNCPSIGGKQQRCTTAKGSRCIDRLEGWR